MMREVRFLAVVCMMLAVVVHADDKRTITIGSKSFTESVILGDMASQLVVETGIDAEHRREIGGTRILWQALLAGQLDIYPEYTGTLIQEIFADQDIPDDAALRRELDNVDIDMIGPLGFNNTYALGMQPRVADERGITSISNLRDHPDLTFGFSNEFMDRGDGWPSLSARYNLKPQSVRGLHHDLAYRSIADGTLDVIDLYTTDAEIQKYGLRMLIDDLNHFPRYDAVLLVRHDAPESVRNVLSRLAGRISQDQMIAMNARVKLDGQPESIVAASFLADTLNIDTSPNVDGFWKRLGQTTVDHLILVAVSLGAAVFVAVPLGVLAGMRPTSGQAIIGACGIVQTIPSLALLVILMKPVRWLGAEGFAAPAVVALFLYSLLPIVRNTATGIINVPLSLQESATALGLRPWARLRLVSLPLASPTILAGIKTSAVINVGFATLGALIGAGGYGQPIMTGIRLDDYRLILEGAVPAALLALVVQGLFELAERRLVPRGLRLKRHH